MASRILSIKQNQVPETSAQKCCSFSWMAPNRDIKNIKTGCETPNILQKNRCLGYQKNNLPKLDVCRTWPLLGKKKNSKGKMVDSRTFFEKKIMFQIPSLKTNMFAPENWYGLEKRSDFLCLLGFRPMVRFLAVRFRVPGYIPPQHIPVLRGGGDTQELHRGHLSRSRGPRSRFPIGSMSIAVSGSLNRW